MSLGRNVSMSATCGRLSLMATQAPARAPRPMANPARTAMRNVRSTERFLNLRILILRAGIFMLIKIHDSKTVSKRQRRKRIPQKAAGIGTEGHRRSEHKAVIQPGRDGDADSSHRLRTGKALRITAANEDDPRGPSAAAAGKMLRILLTGREKRGAGGPNR